MESEGSLDPCPTQLSEFGWGTKVLAEPASSCHLLTTAISITVQRDLDSETCFCGWPPFKVRLSSLLCKPEKFACFWMFLKSIFNLAFSVAGWWNLPLKEAPCLALKSSGGCFVLDSDAWAPSFGDHPIDPPQPPLLHTAEFYLFLLKGEPQPMGDGTRRGVLPENCTSRAFSPVIEQHQQSSPFHGPRVSRLSGGRAEPAVLRGINLDFAWLSWLLYTESFKSRESSRRVGQAPSCPNPECSWVPCQLPREAVPPGPACPLCTFQRWPQHPPSPLQTRVVCPEEACWAHRSPLCQSVFWEALSSR